MTGVRPVAASAGTLAAALLIAATAWLWDGSRAVAADVEDLQGRVGAHEQGSTTRETALDDLDSRFAQVDRAGFQVRSAQASAEQSTFDAAALAADAMPSVVRVTCGDVVGSGFVTDVVPAPGHASVVLTSLAVVDACTYDDGPGFAVEQAGRSLTGELWSWDETNALALVMVEEQLPALPDGLGAPFVGDDVVVIGSALGIESTVTAGRVTNVLDGLVQTDAAINPGNEGGPMLDRSGRVLGISAGALEADGVGFVTRLGAICAELMECDARVLP
ncbi:trypsin-like peptidase domain-containing protein [Aquipuribacter sp. MA13-6]|uniref:trypsin-like peptidase domain-containing protein n=1 Tax=unclassified Aquipuribacter TaxID=2635084 RepID=UPI003EEF291C